MRIFIFIIIGLFIFATASAKEITQKKPHNNVLATSKPTSKNWKPTPFVMVSDRLPANYKGTDPVKFLRLFNSKIVGLKKDELETADDYRTRMLGKEALLAPINFTDQYAFTFDKVIFKYDAETQAYDVESGSVCALNYPYEQDMSTVITCRMATIDKQIDSYKGVNAYGAELEIKRIRGSDFAVAIPRSSSFVDSMLVRAYSFLKYKDKLQINIEKARNLKNMNLGVLFVGKVFDAKVVEVELNLTKPTFDEPIDILVSGKAIPFELNKIFYYVIETGEILGERSF